MRKYFPTACVLAIGVTVSAANAAPLPPDQAQFAPYVPLIGVWDVTPAAGGPVVAQLEFKWGPNKTYVWYGQSLMMGGKPEPHFEGLLGWNGVRKTLDMLLVVDLRYGRAIEEGTFAIQPDGSYIREIKTAFSEGTVPLGEAPVGPDGKSEHFRQTYVKVDDNTMLTTVMHETDKGWAPTFPGSDHLKMVRHANG